MRVALRFAAGLLLLTGTLGHSVTTAQEAAPAASATAIDGLAGRLVVELQKAGVKKVAIFDLDTFDGRQIEFGSWLADRITEGVAKTGTKIEVADRVRLKEFSHAPEVGAAGKNKKPEVAKSLGADAFVDGTFGSIGDAIGISLTASTVDEQPIRGANWGYLAAAKIPLDNAMKSYLSAPVETLRPRDGAFGPWVAGVSVPDCLYCPSPEFSQDATRHRVEGVVELDAVVSVDGRASDIRVKQGLGYGLDEKAVEVVKRWRFKPAHDADGQPIAVRQPIEVAFRFYR